MAEKMIIREPVMTDRPCIVFDNETGDRLLQISETEFKIIYDYRNPEHQRIVAEKIAKEEVGIWNLVTPGIIGLGTSINVAWKIQQLKGQEDQPLRGNVITFPVQRLREFIAVGKHHPAIQKLLRNPQRLLPKRGVLFYHFFAGPLIRNMPHITKLLPTGETTVMICPYDDPYLEAIHNIGAKITGMRNFFFQGTSANRNKGIQSERLENVPVDILRKVSFIIDCSYGVNAKQKGQLSMTDFTGAFNYGTMRDGIFPPPQEVEDELVLLRQEGMRRR